MDISEAVFVELGPMIEGYLDYLRGVRRLAPRSISDIRCTLKQVIRVMNRIRPGHELWQLKLEDYVAWIEECRRAGKSVRSIAKDISHVRGLIDYAWHGGRTDRNVLDGFQLKDLGTAVATPPDTLSIEQAELLIRGCQRSTNEQRVERLMVLLLYGCGLRTAELCSLNVQSIDRDKQELFVRGKGEIERHIPVPDGVWAELLAFLIERGQRGGPLFRTAIKNRRIRGNDVLLAVHRAARRAGLGDEVTPRTLRHSYATHLMDVGVDVGTIASLMGHRSPHETGVYLHALPGRKEEAVAKLCRIRTQNEKGE